MNMHTVLRATSLLTSQLLGTSSDVTDGAPRRRPHGRYVPGNPGRPARRPTLLITVFDNSGSVVCPVGSDPMSNRYAEATRAFAVVARRGARHELGAVLHFDSPTSGDVPPTPITRRGLTELRRGLRVPPDGARFQ